MAGHVVVSGLGVRLRGRTILEAVDLEIDGGVLGLLGPNGAGKTTLLRALATVLRPTQGTVKVDGVPLDGSADERVFLRFRERLGYLPQEVPVLPRFTALEYVCYAAWLKRVPKDEQAPRARRALDRVGLADRADETLRRLSGGMIRRLGVAQAIVHDPALILLDEPTAGLDPSQRIHFRKLAAELAANATVIISTHLVEDVAACCARIVVLNEGRICFDGDRDQLAAQGHEGVEGDSPIERGFTAVLAGTGRS